MWIKVASRAAAAASALITILIPVNNHHLDADSYLCQYDAYEHHLFELCSLNRAVRMFCESKEEM